MLNALLDIIPKEDGNYYFSNYAESIVYALIGFLVVVIGIVVIIFIIWLIGFILRKTNNLAFISNLKMKRKSKEQPTENTMQTLPVNDNDIPDEVKVAITVAIMAYYSEEKPQCEFKVKRIKRI